MKNENSPAFQFYPKDWFDYKVRRMSWMARGVYIDLLAFIWKDTSTQYSIKNDLDSIRKMLGLTSAQFKKIWNEIQWPDDPIFKEKDGYLISTRLRKEKEKQIQNRKKKQEAANKRWSKTDE